MTCALLEIRPATVCLTKESIMKKKNILTCAAIMALLWFTQDMAAMHYDSASTALETFKARAYQG